VVLRGQRSEVRGQSNALWLAALLVLSAGCARRVPQQRLPERTDILAVLVVDPESRGAPEEAPDAVRERLAESLEARNLAVQRGPISALGGQIISGERVKALNRAAQAPYRLLVETRAVFFSQLDGRYRWTVGVRVSATRAADGAAVTEEFNLPAVMQFDHQKGSAAVEAVADEIARRTALALDGLIAAPPSVAAPPAEPTMGSRPRSIYFLMVDRFQNGDRGNDAKVDLADPQAFHGGDLAGAAQRLDWL
jgi:hypothetical protein